MSSIFTKIIAGEIPSYKVAEDENYFAFLDIFPLQLGHCLVIPKKEIDYIFDLEESHYIGLQVFAQKLAKAIKKVIPCERIGVAVIGLEVPHAHIHLIPITEMDDMNFSNEKLKFSEVIMQETCDRISKAFKTYTS